MSKQIVKSRINFKSKVPEVLYKQAGGRCSVPRCTNPTMGQYKENEGAVNMGVACHIYSASEDGPRGWGNKDEVFISSEKNGIWCCAYHASLIDKIKGKDYTVGTLFSWKKLAEARNLKQMNDTPSPLGWVESIAISRLSNSSIRPNIELSRWNLLSGDNGVGKTALLEFAASISNAKYAERFSRNKASIFEAFVNYCTVDSFEKEVKLSINDGYLKRFEDARECLLPPGDLEVIYCDLSDIKNRQHEDHIDLMQRILNVDHAALLSLCNIGTKTLMAGEIKFEAAILEDDNDWDIETDSYKTKPKLKPDEEPFYDLMFKSNQHNNFISYGGLSTSGRARLILDLQITKARETAKQRLTLLLVEGLALNFDKVNFRALLCALEKEKFQTIVSIPPYRHHDIIEKIGSEMALKDHDYLSSWRLKIIK